MKIEYSADGKTAFYCGYKFRKDPKTGYFLCTKKTDAGKRERLHVYVWRKEHGEIPNGYHVHHRDEDKDNNEPENLVCISGKAHTFFHASERAALFPEEIRQNLVNNAVPKARKWHKSEDGREWHSKHAKQTIARLEKVEYVCSQCGRRYYALPIGSEKKYCSNACRARARRDSGIDNEKRKCPVCGKEFICNRYSKQECCCQSCAATLRWNRRSSETGERAGL